MTAARDLSHRRAPDASRSLCGVLTSSIAQLGDPVSDTQSDLAAERRAAAKLPPCAECARLDSV